MQVTHRLFAGAKVVDILRGYEKSQGIARFDNAVDWGWFWFLTQPLFWLLDIFSKFIGNFGIAILMLTVVVKLLFFPLANASFKSMSRMKKVQPYMEEIKKAHKDDPQRQQQEMMALYKREKVNPLTGCLPMLIQIPVFFSLYKVLYVTIEMRQAPFYGWIHDLSAPDPTSILNLFGLLPYHIPALVPAYLSIGIWPILMGITQFVQTKLNPAPADPVQAKMFTFMPLIFTFMFATFPAGLVIYYTWNNLLSVTQQYVIMRREGVEGASVRESEVRQGEGEIDGRRGCGIRAQTVCGALRFLLGHRRHQQPAAAEPAGNRLRRPLQCRQVEPDQCADQPQRPGPRQPHAGAHPRDQFLQSGRQADPHRPAGLWLCQGIQDLGGGMAAS